MIAALAMAPIIKRNMKNDRIPLLTKDSSCPEPPPAAIH